MSDVTNFNDLRGEWKQAVDDLIEALRGEEALATPEHSMVETEAWDKAQFAIRESEKRLGDARDAYKNALRKKNYGF